MNVSDPSPLPHGNTVADVMVVAFAAMLTVMDVGLAMAQLDGAETPRLWVATCGAQAAGERPLPLALAQEPRWPL